MVDNTIDFEQMDILRRIARGWNPVREFRWFQNLESSLEWHRTAPPSKFLVFIDAFTEIIICNGGIPFNFALDFDRLRTLQLIFQNIIYLFACHRALVDTLRVLGWHETVPQESCTELNARVCRMFSDEEVRHSFRARNECVALEIAKMANEVRQDANLPRSEILAPIERFLKRSCNRQSDYFEERENHLGDRLQELVSKEANALVLLTPLQIKKRQVPHGFKYMPGLDNEEIALEYIAKRVAHMGTLHWRVWAPTVYSAPTADGGPVETNSQDDESSITDENHEISPIDHAEQGSSQG